jgi:CheY-like chemotaxis protein
MNLQTILAVDDNEIQNYALARTLEIAGFVVKRAYSGSQTLLLAKENPDLILLDINLPDISGFEVCRQLQTDNRTKTIPVVFLSATYQSPDAVAAARSAGALALLFHPVQPDELIAVIRGALARPASTG